MSRRRYMSRGRLPGALARHSALSRLSHPSQKTSGAAKYLTNRSSLEAEACCQCRSHLRICRIPCDAVSHPEKTTVAPLGLFSEAEADEEFGTRSRTLKTAWRCSDLCETRKGWSASAKASGACGRTRRGFAGGSGEDRRMDRQTLRDWVIRYNEQGPTVSSTSLRQARRPSSTTRKSRAHAVLILKQAGWHGAKDLKAPKNISLLPLPPRAPKLNPQENIWQLRSCPTEGLQHLFMRRRRLRIPRRLGLVLIRPRQHVVQFMEGVIAAHFRIADRRLDAVIARDESRID